MIDRDSCVSRTAAHRIDRDAIAIVLANVASILAGEAGLSRLLAQTIRRLIGVE